MDTSSEIMCLLEEIRSLKSALAATTLSFSNALLQQNFELLLQVFTFLQHECCMQNHYTIWACTKTTEAENFLRIISSNYSTEALHLRAMFDLHRTLPEDLAPHSFTRSLSKVPGHACLMLPVFDLLYIKCSQMFLMILHSISLLHLDSRSRTCR